MVFSDNVFEVGGCMQDLTERLQVVGEQISHLLERL